MVFFLLLECSQHGELRQRDESESEELWEFFGEFLQPIPDELQCLVQLVFVIVADNLLGFGLVVSLDNPAYVQREGMLQISIDHCLADQENLKKLNRRDLVARLIEKEADIDNKLRICESLHSLRTQVQDL